MPSNPNELVMDPETGLLVPYHIAHEKRERKYQKKLKMMKDVAMLDEMIRTQKKRKAFEQWHKKKRKSSK